jgi:aldose 1-epimerase
VSSGVVGAGRGSVGQTSCMFELRAGDLMVEIDPENGGRISRLVIDGNDLILRGSGADDPKMWGSYPMVPWAGRVRNAAFEFGGETHRLPVNDEPHSIHGTGFITAWDRIGEASISTGLGSYWPFGGTSVQHFALTPRSLTCVLEVHADDRPMPAMLGWHPWFVKPDSLDFSAGRMYLRAADYVPDGTSVAVPPGPWDDCFADVRQPLVLHWGDTALALSSSCDHWVVYDQPGHATCAEPQTGPPDAFNLAPLVVQPGRPLIHTFTLSVL